MDNGIRDLPSSWALVKLGEFVENEKGKKPKNESPEKTETHSIPYVDIQAFEENIIRKWTDGVGCRKCYETDFLMVWDGSRSGLVGNGMNGALGSTLVRINFPSMVNKYAYYFLQSKYQQINTRAKGSGTPHVDPDLVWNYNFPIPPVYEQHRIVAKIEELFSELDQGIDNLKTAQAQLKVYRQALLKHAFEGKLTAEWRAQNADKLESASALQQRIQHAREQRYQQQLAEWQTNGKQGSKPKVPKPIAPLTAEELAELPELPEGWGWAKLEDITTKITDGDHQAPPQTKSGVPFITISDIKNQKIDFSDTRFVSKEYFESLAENRKALKGDVLYTVTGSFGIPCLLDFDKDFCFQRHIGLLSPESSISAKFLFHLLSSRFIYLQAVEVATGTAQKTVPLGGLRLFKVPLISHSEQQAIVDVLELKLSEIDQLDQTITTSLQQAEALRQSILKKAFSGELVPQDPNDEPAAALLARIQAEKGKRDVRRQ